MPTEVIVKIFVEFFLVSFVQRLDDFAEVNREHILL